RPAALAGVVERVLVHLLGDRVVDDVDRVHALVVPLDPGVDPERLDADDLLLLVGHTPGHVHHVDDARDGVALGGLLPAPVLLVLADRDDLRGVRVVGAGGDLPPQGAAVGPLEVPQALRPDAADAL